MAHIPFYLDPTVPPNSNVTSDQIRQAYFAAMRVWESADPRIKFDYKGDWTGPGYQGDRVSVFAYGSGVTTSTDPYGYLIEADIVRSVHQSDDAWAPCEQRDGSCTNTSALIEVQDLFTHELGHTLGLADLDDTHDNYWMTMDHVPHGHERFRCTLGLGDVLGLRSLYPTDAPMPTIYDP